MTSTEPVPAAPTPEQCTDNSPMGDGGYACWYPQMGGYVGRAVVYPQGGCFEAYVWHDGEFPFGPDSGGERSKLSPARLHHCMADQFIRFGTFVASLPGMDDRD